MLLYKAKLELRSLLIFGIILLLFATKASSQEKYNIMGKVRDKNTKTTLVGANVVLKASKSATMITGATTDTSGFFILKNISPGNYILEISFVGYKTDTVPVVVKDADVRLRGLFLTEIQTEIKGAEIKETQTRVEIKGDTMEIKADAYKTNRDATAEDLVKKMPGITSDGNNIKVHGEEVKKVLVDGKPFFGDDPTATLRNLPAEIVDNVQIFDQWSDQAAFTGFRDGNEEKTLNLRTKKGQNIGTFGKIYAGYGTDERYNAGFTFNRFNGPQRISLLGMSNNINQQNFNIADIMSVMSNSGQSFRGGPGMRGGGGGGGGGMASNFFSGQQSGLTKTNAIGLNYIDNWGTRIKVSGNYFFNQTENTNLSTISRDYFTREKFHYEQNSRTETKNINHRFNFKFEYAIDSANKLTLTPKLTYQKNNTQSTVDGRNYQPITNFQTNRTQTNSASDAEAYNFSNEALLQHKFRKNRRTLSLSLTTQINNQLNNGSYYTGTDYFDTIPYSEIRDQQYKTDGKTTSLGGNISYTEPVGANGQILVSYKPNYTLNESKKNYFEKNATGDYSLLDSVLSNRYENRYNTQRGGVSYRLSIGKVNFSAGADVQQAELTGKQEFPQTFTTKKTFNTILPSSSLSIRFSKNVNLFINYRSSTRSPSVSQLQNTADVSNPLFVRAGNPDLRESYENNLSVRFMRRIQEGERHYFVFLNGTQSNRYITNATYMFRNDTVINGVSIKRGSQFIIPVNMDNYYSFRGFGAYGMPLNFIKCNLNLNAGYNYTRNPAILNNREIYSNNNAITYGTFLSSNISKNLDFSLAYNGSYNFVTQTMRGNSTYYTHTGTFKITYTLLERFVINTDIAQYNYTGLSEGYNTSYTLWNGYLAYKFLKDKSLELKVSVADILNQNRSISRNVTESYTEDVSTITLGRYAMVTLTYTFRKFKLGAIAPEEIKLPKHFPPPPGGGFGPPPPRD